MSVDLKSFVGRKFDQAQERAQRAPIPPGAQLSFNRITSVGSGHAALDLDVEAVYVRWYVNAAGVVVDKTKSVEKWTIDRIFGVIVEQLDGTFAASTTKTHKAFHSIKAARQFLRAAFCDQVPGAELMSLRGPWWMGNTIKNPKAQR